VHLVVRGTPGVTLRAQPVPDERAGNTHATRLPLVATKGNVAMSRTIRTGFRHATGNRKANSVSPTPTASQKSPGMPGSRTRRCLPDGTSDTKRRMRHVVQIPSINGCVRPKADIRRRRQAAQ
jgi:hypothetical protein